MTCEMCRTPAEVHFSFLSQNGTRQGGNVCRAHAREWWDRLAEPMRSSAIISKPKGEER